MSYTVQYVAAWVIAAALAGVGFVQARGVAEFGLPAAVGPWLGLAVAVLGVVQLALPKVVGPSAQTPAAHAAAVETPPHG